MWCNQFPARYVAQAKLINFWPPRGQTANLNPPTVLAEDHHNMHLLCLVHWRHLNVILSNHYIFSQNRLSCLSTDVRCPVFYVWRSWIFSQSHCVSLQNLSKSIGLNDGQDSGLLPSCSELTSTFQQTVSSPGASISLETWPGPSPSPFPLPSTLSFPFSLPSPPFHFPSFLPFPIPSLLILFPSPNPARWSGGAL